LKRIVRKLTRRKDLHDLARIRLNGDQIRNGATLAGDERQAQEQMPVNSELSVSERFFLNKFTLASRRLTVVRVAKNLPKNSFRKYSKVVDFQQEN
jgi:hypothetical protein